MFCVRFCGGLFLWLPCCIASFSLAGRLLFSGQQGRQPAWQEPSRCHQQQRQRAIAADVAVTHDFEAALAALAAAKAISRVGKAILMQCPGDEQPQRHGEGSRNQRWQTERGEGYQRGTSSSANHGSGKRE